MHSVARRVTPYSCHKFCKGLWVESREGIPCRVSEARVKSLPFVVGIVDMWARWLLFGVGEAVYNYLVAFYLITFYRIIINSSLHAPLAPLSIYPWCYPHTCDYPDQKKPPRVSFSSFMSPSPGSGAATVIGIAGMWVRWLLLEVGRMVCEYLIAFCRIVVNGSLHASLALLSTYPWCSLLCVCSLNTKLRSYISLSSICHIPSMNGTQFRS